MFNPPPAQSKHEQVRHYLVELIRAGRMQPGQKLPSETELARRIQVSRLTVRRAITGLVADGMLRSEPGVGHVVRATAPKATIGILFNAGAFTFSQSSRYVSAFPFLLLHALNRELGKRHCTAQPYLPSLLTGNAAMDQAAEVDEHPLITDVRRRRLSGLVGVYWPPVAAAEPTHQRFNEQLETLLREQEIPWVSVIGRIWSNAVTVDMDALISQAIISLKGQGSQRLGLLAGGRQAGDMQASFTRSARSAGLHVREPWIGSVTHHGEAEGYRWFHELWSQPERPDGVVVTDDLLARGVMTAALRHGVRIPQELRIAHLWVKGNELFMPCPSTRLQIDPAQMARSAVDKLLRMARDPNGVTTRTLVRPQTITITDPASQPLSEAMD